MNSMPSSYLLPPNSEILRFYSVLRVLGCFPFKNDLELSRIWGCITAFHHGAMTIYGIIRGSPWGHTTEESQGSLLLGILSKAFILSLVTVDISFGIETFRKRQVFVKLFKNLNMIDQKLRKIGIILTDANKIYLSFIDTFIFVIVMASGDYIQILTLPTKDIMGILYFYYGSLVFLDVRLKLYLYNLSLLNHRFNVLLEQLCVLGDSVNYFGKSEKIEVLIQCHYEYCRLAAYINECSGVQILVYCATAMVLLVVMFYYEYFALADRTLSSNEIINVAVIAIWIFYNCRRLYQITTSSEIVSKKGAKFNDILLQIVLNDDTQDITTNKKLHGYITSNNNFIFTACGFFPLNYSILTAMAGSATTYLVILIQFSSPANNPSTSLSREDQPSQLPTAL